MMNRFKRLMAWLAIGLSLVTAAGAQTPAPDRAAEHDALRQLRARVVAAIDAQDAKALAACFTREFVLTSVDQTVVTNEASLAAYYGRMFKDPQAPIAKMETVADADALTRFIDANTGICTGSSLDTYTLKDGRVMRIRSRWTAVVLKEGVEWKVAAAHIGVNFLDNPVLTARSLSVWRKLGIWLHLAKPPTD